VPASDASPDSSFTTRLTPDSDSEDDMALDDGQLGESFQLQRQRNDVDDTDDEDEHESRRRRASISTVQSYQLYTPDEERAVVKKFDQKLVLFVALLYMLSFLDRSSMCIISHLG
jgi:hypothetical protein